MITALLRALGGHAALQDDAGRRAHVGIGRTDRRRRGLQNGLQNDRRHRRRRSYGGVDILYIYIYIYIYIYPIYIGEGGKMVFNTIAGTGAAAPMEE